MMRSLATRLANLEERLTPHAPFILVWQRTGAGETYEAAKERGRNDPTCGPRTNVIVLDERDMCVL